MKIRDLIKKLQNVNPEAEVVIPVDHSYNIVNFAPHTAAALIENYGLYEYCGPEYQKDGNSICPIFIIRI